MRPSLHPSSTHDLGSSDLALEVIVLWGESVLHVAHLPERAEFSIGDAVATDGRPATDFLIGRETLGSERVTLVREASVLLPDEATCSIYENGRLCDLDELADAGALEVVPEDGSVRYALTAQNEARIEHRGLSFFVRLTSRPEKVASAASVRPREHTWTLTSAGAHLALLFAFSLAPPHSAALSLDRLHYDSAVVSYELDGKELPEPEPTWMKDPSTGTSEPSGERTRGDEGEMGDEKAPRTTNRAGVKGPPDNKTIELPRERLDALDPNIGILGVLQKTSWNTPTSIYGRDQALGNDAESVLGALLGDAIGLNRGHGGLAMTHTGRGGGGTALASIGVGPLGTRRGDGNYGKGVGFTRGHDGRPPDKIRFGKPDVRGSLSKEVIRRVIHRHLAEVRYCYEQGLVQRPELQGRVAVKFIIHPSGRVATAARSDSTLGVPRVEQCIVDAVSRMTFPAPDGGGVVVVTYPFVLERL